jgi:two-component system LytT family response regulator
MECIAIDDEPLALDVIKYHSEKIPFIKLNALFVDAFKALDYIHDNGVDLIFMDISMPDISGLNLIKSLPDPPMVIFTTAYSSYAAESYEVSAVGYLVKPILFDRFLMACNKAHAVYKNGRGINDSGREHSTKFVIVKSGHESFKINFEMIQYIEAEGNFVNFVTIDRKIITRLSIKEALKLLPEQQFIQVHRSFIISLSYLTKFENHQLLVANKNIPLGGSYKQNFMDMLAGYHIKNSGNHI